MTAVRKALHAYLSEEAHDAWHRFAEDNGVSLSAVLTALGPSLSEKTDMTTGQKLESVITQAEDAEREKRRERRKAIAQRTLEKANQKTT
jgi:hypothetical protein